MPTNYKIVNRVDGKNLTFDDIHLSGTALHSPFTNYMSDFSEKENEVVILSDGLVYYLVKDDGKTFFTEANYGASMRFGLDWLKTEVMINDLKVKTYFGRNYLPIVFGGPVAAIIWAFLLWGIVWVFGKIKWFEPEIQVDS